MILYNEIKVRKYLKDNSVKVFEVSEDDIVTPQAKEYLNDCKVKLVIKKKNVDKKQPVLDYQKPLKGKPENMTHLYGKELVPKTDPVIAFRGKIDSFQSDILLIQNRMFELKDNKAVEVLDNILNFVRSIMQAEVKSIKFDGWEYLGMESSEIRERSHNPNKFYGVKHIMPNYKMGEKVLQFNKLRSSVREIELLAVCALEDRIDIIEALNRLSSFIYIYMIQIHAQERDK